MSDLLPYDRPTVSDLSDQIERTAELIGRGGYGSVYKGRWLEAATNTTPAIIAIKVIDLVPLSEDAKRKRRFKQITRELSLWCSIQHENILPLLGIARIDGDTNIPAFVCPWMENGNAKEFCSRNPRFPPLFILFDIINGLHYLHTFKPEIVHGDIKAVNVLINNRCEACLCDFGLSRFITEDTLWRTTATAAGGTARWMAPELINAEVSTPTKESDIYAYAMTCYEILSGDVPFKSISNDVAVLFKVTKGQRPDRIESFHSDFMWDIINRCWEQQPKNRLQTEKVSGLLRPKVDWKRAEEEQAKSVEKDVALAKEMAVLKEQMVEAKAEEDRPGQTSTPSGFLTSSIDIPTLIATKGYNPIDFDTKPTFARYLVIKSYTEYDVHMSLKYEIWSSSDQGNKRLDKAFKEANGRGPVYLFFSVNASGHFCGMAEMLTPVDYTRSSTVWASDKWKGVFKVRWIFVRDIPYVNLHHIKLNNTQKRKPVTHSRDARELLPEAGQEMLRIFHTYPDKTSTLARIAQITAENASGAPSSPVQSNSVVHSPQIMPTDVDEY